MISKVGLFFFKIDIEHFKYRRYLLNMGLVLSLLSLLLLLLANYIKGSLRICVKARWPPLPQIMIGIVCGLMVWISISGFLYHELLILSQFLLSVSASFLNPRCIEGFSCRSDEKISWSLGCRDKAGGDVSSFMPLSLISYLFLILTLCWAQGHWW